MPFSFRKGGYTQNQSEGLLKPKALYAQKEAN